MSNMSYCRFQNTEKDLSDCAEALEGLLGTDPDMEPLSNAESRAAVNLASRCFDIAKLFADHFNTSVDELMDTNTDARIQSAIDAANAELKTEEEQQCVRASPSN